MHDIYTSGSLYLMQPPSLFPHRGAAEIQNHSHPSCLFLSAHFASDDLRPDNTLAVFTMSDIKPVVHWGWQPCHPVSQTHCVPTTFCPSPYDHSQAPFHNASLRVQNSVSNTASRSRQRTPAHSVNALTNLRSPRGASTEHLQIAAIALANHL